MHRWLPPEQAQPEHVTRRSATRACIAVGVFIGIVVILSALAHPEGQAVRQELALATTSLVAAFWQVAMFMGRHRVRPLGSSEWRGLLGSAAGAGGVTAAVTYALPPGLISSSVWLATAAAIPIAAVLITWLIVGLARERSNGSEVLSGIDA